MIETYCRCDVGAASNRSDFAGRIDWVLLHCQRDNTSHRSHSVVAFDWTVSQPVWILASAN